MVELLVRASAGDALAECQLKAAHKMIHPETYEVPRTVIEELAGNYHTKPTLARGFALRHLMGALSWIVEPDGEHDVLSGPVRLVRDPPSHERGIYEEATRPTGDRCWQSPTPRAVTGPPAPAPWP